MTSWQKGQALMATRSKGSGSVFRRPNGMFVYQWYDPNGKQHWQSLRTTNRKVAVKRAEELAKSVTARDQETVLFESARLRRIINTKPLPFADIWKEFEATRPSGSPGTLRNYRAAIDEFVAWCKAVHPEVEGLHHVTPAVAEEFLASVWGRGVSANRHNYIRGALSLVTARLAKSYGMANPWPQTDRKDDPARGRQKRRALTAEQTADLLKLLDNPDAEVRWREDMSLLFRLGLFAGMREKDAALLRWADVDLGRRMFRYTPAKTRGKAIIVEVPMVPEVAGEIVARWNRRDPAQEHILPDIAAEYQRRGKKGAGTKAVEKETVRLVQKITGDGRAKPVAGDPQRKRIRAAFGFHSCRHTFCSVLAQRGVPLAKLAAMTGDSPNTLQAFYVHVEGEHAELNTAFAPLLTNGNTRSPKAELLAKVEGMSDDEADRVLALLRSDER